MYEIAFSHRSKKALKKLARSGSFDTQSLKQALDILVRGTKLPVRYKDHALKGSLSTFREFHLAFDVLVKYEQDETLKLLTIVDIGSHQELFGN
jgi:mRNA interferase YafQ